MRWFSVACSRIFSLNFYTVTNFVRLKLTVQFDICCRTGLILRSLTEAKRNWMFASFQQKNKRQSAVSLIQFTYDLVFSTLRDEEIQICTNYPRLTPPREHSNATTKAYAMPRDWSVNGGEDGSVSYKPNSTASRNSQRCGV